MFNRGYAAGDILLDFSSQGVKSISWRGRKKPLMPAPSNAGPPIKLGLTSYIHSSLGDEMQRQKVLPFSIAFLAH